MNNRRKSSNNQSAKGNIRIIAGQHRGRKLPVIMAEGLRPTTDRVKETVFNWLMPYIHGSRCLDCFSGAGSLGFEAYSRGAEHVTMIELNKAAANQLIINKQTLNAKGIDVINQDALLYLQGQPTPYDIIFIDPPFRQGLTNKVINQINQGWLNDDTLIYIETEAEQATKNVPENWQLLKEKVAGQVAYQLYQVIS